MKIKETGCASNTLCCPISTMLSTSRFGCCAVTKMPKTIEDRANKGIAAITSIPIGTVMSSLPRTRRLDSVLANSTRKEAVREM